MLDFGIAKLQTFPSGGGMQTRTGTLMGTPVYMSPEQCLGTKTIDSRSDIYAMGIIMFEMLSGRPPFLSEGFGELVNMHLNIRPPSLRDVNASIPQPVEALIAKALEKAPEARHRSAAELQIDIRAAAGSAIVIRGTSSPDLISDTMLGIPPAGRTKVMPGSTTMTSGTGERFATTVPVVRASGSRRWLMGAVVIAAVGAAAFVVMTRRAREAATARGTSVGARSMPSTGATLAPTVTKPVVPIRLTIESRPPGAVVTDLASGKALGSTPVVVERAPSKGPVTVRVEKPGFVLVTRALELDRDRTETIALAALPRDPKPDSPKAPSNDVLNKAPSVAGKPPGAGHPPKAKGQAKKPPRPQQPIARPDDEPAKL